ncbi:hypothetical protein NFJ02_38g96530 [Pycnococcus provasolii]
MSTVENVVAEENDLAPSGPAAALSASSSSSSSSCALSLAPRPFLEARYKTVLSEKRELSLKLALLEQELAEKEILIEQALQGVQGCKGDCRIHEHAAKSPMRRAIQAMDDLADQQKVADRRDALVGETPSAEVETCSVCLDDVIMPTTKRKGAQQHPRAATILGCGHAHHFECVALLVAAHPNHELKCPRCRYTEPKLCEFQESSSTTTASAPTPEAARAAAAANRARGDDEPAEEAAQEEAERRRTLVGELLSRAIGVAHGDGTARSRNGGGAAVLVPVPAIPVNSLDELRACSTGQKRAIFMPPALPTAAPVAVGGGGRDDFYDDEDDEEEDELLARERAARVARMREAQRRKDEEAVHSGLREIEDALEERERRAAEDASSPPNASPGSLGTSAAIAGRSNGSASASASTTTGVTWMRRSFMD